MTDLIFCAIFLEEFRLNSATLMIHSESLQIIKSLQTKFSIFPVWRRHKLPSGDYSKTFASNVVDASKKLYSKLKVTHKNAQKWTKTLFFNYEPAHKAGKMKSLEMTSYLCGKTFSDCSPMIFRFLVKFWWRKVHRWRINIKFQWDYKSNQTLCYRFCSIFKVSLVSDLTRRMIKIK